MFPTVAFALVEHSTVIITPALSQVVGNAGRSLGFVSQGVVGYADTMMDRTAYKVSQNHSCCHF